jgi:hypothetical protein
MPVAHTDRAVSEFHKLRWHGRCRLPPPIFRSQSQRFAHANGPSILLAAAAAAAAAMAALIKNTAFTT